MLYISEDQFRVQSTVVPTVIYFKYFLEEHKGYGVIVGAKITLKSEIQKLSFSANTVEIQV